MSSKCGIPADWSLGFVGNKPISHVPAVVTGVDAPRLVRGGCACVAVRACVWALSDQCMACVRA